MLTLKANTLFIRPNVSQTVSASGGVEPYTFSVAAGGIGGTIDSSGKYTAPSGVYGRDTIQVIDDDAATAEIIMRVLSPIELMAQIIQSELGLDNGRVWLFNQKINEPTDYALYIVLRELQCRPFSNSLKFEENAGVDAKQSVNWWSQVSIDIKSRGLDAYRRKEEVVMALASQYAEQQQTLNAFKIGKVPTNIPNLGEIDGSAVPYRYNITVNVQYSVTRTQVAQYYDDFQDVSVVIDK